MRGSFFLLAVTLVVQHLGAVGAQKKCEAIFEGGDFTISRAILNGVKDDFQKLVDCLPDGEKLKLEPGLTIKPTSTVVVKNGIKLTSMGKGKQRPVFTCPGAGKPLLEISSTGVELKNIIVSDCVTDSNATSALVVDIDKTNKRETTSLDLAGVEFIRNTNLNGSASMHIKSLDSLSLKNVEFFGNVGAFGGAIFLNSSGIRVDINDCAFENNTARFFVDKEMEGKGAALFQNASAFVTVTGSKFLNNFGEDQGGAMAIKGEPPASSLTLENTTFRNNTAGILTQTVSRNGGAILALGPKLEFSMKNCTLTENKAISQGGAIFLLSSRRPGEIKAKIEDSYFQDNVALIGGALWAQSRNNWRMGVDISGSTFVENVAKLQRVEPGSPFENAKDFAILSPGRGGAIVCTGSSVDFKSSGNVYEKNTAIGLGGFDQLGPEGGALVLADVENVTITGDIFRENTAKSLDSKGREGAGGAILMSANGVDAAKVLHAPLGSECECDDKSEVIALGILNPIGGCGKMNTANGPACALKDATKCEGLIPEGNFIRFNNRQETGARCEIVTINSNAKISNTTFVGNAMDGAGGAIFLKDKGLTLTLGKGVDFIRNEARNSKGGALVISDGATMLAPEGVKIVDNVATTDGGGVVLEGPKANLRLQNAVFIGNTAKNGVGGAIASHSSDSAIKITGKSVFKKNEAGKSGGAMACTSDRSTVTISNANFSNNRASVAGGALHAKSARGEVLISLLDTMFSKNRIKQSPDSQVRGKGGAVSLEGAAIKVVISGGLSTFDSNSAREGGGIRLFDARIANISQTGFVNNEALSGGGLHVSFTTKDADSIVKLTDVEFKGNMGFMGGGIMADSKSANLSFVPDNELSEEVFLPSELSQVPQLSLEGVRFVDQKIVKDGGGMFLLDIHAEGQNCDFLGNRVSEGFNGGGGGVKLMDSARLDLISGRFVNNQAFDGGAISISNSFLFGRDLEFTKNLANRHGGAISVEGSVRKDKSMVTLDGGEIDGNEANFGGGIFVDVQEPEGINDACRSADTKFIKMGPSKLIRSVVAGACDDQKQSSLTSIPSVNLNKTLIINNRADQGGGGIFTGSPSFVCACCRGECTDYCRPDGLGSDFNGHPCGGRWTGNKLGMKGYGPLVASFGSRAEVLKSDQIPLLNDELLDEAHKSGDVMASLKIQMKDHFDQGVTVTRPNVFARLETTRGEILSGQVDTLVVEGVANFNATVISAFPGDYNMSLSFPGQTVKGIRFRVMVRDCLRGENSIEGQLLSSFSCRQCEANSFSFTPEQPCKPCPASTTCDTKTLTPIDGYWHSSSWSESIHKCLVHDACSYESRSATLKSESEQSGPVPLNFTQQQLCRKGYEGPLCGSCTKGYGRLRAFECSKCLSRGMSIALMIAIVLVMVVIVGFIVRNALKTGTPIKSDAHSNREEALTTNPEQPSVYLGVNPATENAKILINFLQVTSIALLINVEWRQEVRRVLQLEDLASGFSSNESIISLDCVLPECVLPVSIRRSIMAMLLPLTVAVFPIYFLLRGCFNKTKAQLFFRKAFVSCLVVAYVFYTGMTKRAMKIFHGVSLDSEDSKNTFAHGRFWADDTNLGYMEGHHLYLALFLGLPVLLVYSIGYPGYLLYVLRGNKENLSDQYFATSYGFVYRAYREECVYWEIVVMVRKALLAGVVVFVYELGGNLQSVLAVAVLVGALILHLNNQPYREELSQMNHREGLSLSVSVFTYMAGIAFNDERLPRWSEVALSVLLVGTTGALVIYLVSSQATESARHLETLLEERAVAVPESANTRQKVWLLANSYWFAAMERFWRFVDEGIAWSKNKKSGGTDAV